MVIQIILVVGVCALMLHFLSSSGATRTKAWVKIYGVLFTLLAIVLIVSPQTANRIANLVGVGRGADLLLYLLTLVFVFVCMNIYIKSKRDEQRLVALSRKITLLEAQLSSKPKSAKR